MDKPVHQWVCIYIVYAHKHGAAGVVTMVQVSTGPHLEQSFQAMGRYMRHYFQSRRWRQNAGETT